MRTSALARLAGLAAAGVALAACGSSSSTASAPSTAPPTTAPPTTATTRGSGPVDVLYAGSLVTTMEHVVAPAFGTDTGYTFSGTSGDSGSLANEIKAKAVEADVFVSASPAKDQLLEGAANGDLVSWYATFATSPLLIAYSTGSRFAASLQAEPWYQAITQPGILVGRTDPTTDPKGKLTAEVLQAAATTHQEPALATLATSTSDVFPESTLVGRLEAGQLDAGFFYSVEATAAHLPTVALTGSDAHATYTITIPAGAPHPQAAAAFVTWLLGPRGRAALTSEGLTLTSPPAVSGTAPGDLSAVLAGS